MARFLVQLKTSTGWRGYSAHVTREEAESEQRRLQALNPNKVFRVIER